MEKKPQRKGQLKTSTVAQSAPTASSGVSKQTRTRRRHPLRSNALAPTIISSRSYRREAKSLYQLLIPILTLIEDTNYPNSDLKSLIRLFRNCLYITTRRIPPSSLRETAHQLLSSCVDCFLKTTDHSTIPEPYTPTVIQQVLEDLQSNEEEFATSVFAFGHHITLYAPDLLWSSADAYA